MWPFKKKKKEKVFCKHCQIANTKCNRRAIPSEVSVVTGHQQLYPSKQTDCEWERELLLGRWFPWNCGKRGKYFKNKNQFS